MTSTRTKFFLPSACSDVPDPTEAGPRNNSILIPFLNFSSNDRAVLSLSLNKQVIARSLDIPVNLPLVCSFAHPSDLILQGHTIPMHTQLHSVMTSFPFSDAHMSWSRSKNM